MINGDGRRLPFGDNEFDICFSNSVIEHVGDIESQRAFSQEIRRVAKRYYVQTPNKMFFMETHMIAPFIHWLPLNVQRKLARNFTIWGWLVRPDQEHVDNFISKTKLLTEEDMMSLFPDAAIVREKFLFLTKSLIAVKL